MIGPRFSEQVEYLFNYAPSEFSSWARYTFTGTALRSVGTVYGLLFVGFVAVLIIKPPRRDNA